MSVDMAAPTCPEILPPRKGRNEQYEWDEFDPVDYVKRNYAVLREPDRRIIREVRNYFSAVADPYSAPGTRGIDVGSGPNLYPAMCMLPFVGEVTLSDHAESNVRWLEQEVWSYSAIWDPFWHELAESRPYAAIRDARAQLWYKAKVAKGDLFKLPRARWDIGTMFFVAESISGERFEFIRATHRFVRALKPGRPFAAAFMAGSKGYEVGGNPYPAVEVQEADVRECLKDVAHEVDIHAWPVDSGNHEPLREGYSGMILALGKAGAQ
jgi:NNMT/PNMT/TEMT family